MLPGAEPGRLAACLRFLFPHVLRFRRRTNRDKLFNNIDPKNNQTRISRVFILCITDKKIFSYNKVAQLQVLPLMFEYQKLVCQIGTIWTKWKKISADILTN